MHDAFDISRILEIHEHQWEREEGQTGPDDVGQKVRMPAKYVSSGRTDEDIREVD